MAKHHAPLSTKYMQGKFKPKNPNKYVGDPNNIVYRSSWELAFLRILDDNKDVVKYASEEIALRYYNPIKLRWARYFPDFIIEIREGDKTIKQLIEIKPINQTFQPKQGKRKKMQTYLNEMMEYAVNQAKWKAAKKWCDQQGLQFRVVSRTPDNAKFITLNEEQLGLI